jgi:hypothetical protein
MLWRACCVVTLFFNTAVAAMALFYMSRGQHHVVFRGHALVPEPAQAVEFKDFASILLTAVAVMFAIATVVIALAAIWGFSQLKDEAAKVARDVASTVAKARAEEIVPGVVEQALNFDKQAVSAVDADKIAQEYGK